MIVTGAVLLAMILEELRTDVVEELVAPDKDEIPGSVAPARTAMMKFALGTRVPLKVDFN